MGPDVDARKGERRLHGPALHRLDDVDGRQRDVTGIVRLKLYKGNIIVAGRKSPKSLYDPKIATMEGDESAYDQGDATGFIRLNALRLKVRAALKHARK